MTASKELIVLGGGEHARVVIEAARSCPDQWHVAGFVDPLPCSETVRSLGVPRLGDDRECLAILTPDQWIVLGIGQIGSARARVVERYSAAEGRWATVIHATAWVSPTASLGAGVVVLVGAVVNAGAKVGDHCVINSGVILEHDVRLDPFAHVAPAVVVGGGTTVGPGSYLGLGCRIRDHIQIGRAATVGMGAVVIDSVPDEATVFGVPARIARRGGEHG